MLTDIGAPALPGLRSPMVESVLGCDSRVGGRRLLKLFRRFGMKVCLLAVARAAGRNPALIRAYLDGGHELVSCHCRRLDCQLMLETEEREHVRLAFETFDRVCGTAPVGWKPGGGRSGTAASDDPLLVGVQRQAVRPEPWVFQRRYAACSCRRPQQRILERLPRLRPAGAGLGAQPACFGAAAVHLGGNGELLVVRGRRNNKRRHILGSQPRMSIASHHVTRLRERGRKPQHSGEIVSRPDPAVRAEAQDVKFGRADTRAIRDPNLVEVGAELSEKHIARVEPGDVALNIFGSLDILASI